MQIKELITLLNRLVEADEYLADANVNFGRDCEPVAGGIIVKNGKTGLVELNLASIKLDLVGGF